jgi:hypothetical protein
MKRFITYIVCSAFLISLSGNVAAVEKKEKKQVKKQVVQKKKAPAKKSTRIVPRGKRKYDTFVDRNKNGIDDRKENLKQKPAAKAPKKKAKKKK